MPGRLTLAQARRIALAAQGFGRPRPAAITMRHVQATIDAVAQFQIDSINVAVRAHYMPLFARLGPYDRALLDRAAGVAPRRLFEYWGHAACLVDVALAPALAVRMRHHAARRPEGLERALAANPDLLDRVLAEVAASGPVTARDIDTDERRRPGPWWDWSEAKHVLEHLFDAGVLAVAGRTPAFERRYDLAVRVLPPAVRALPEVSDAAAHDALVRRAVRALGVADAASAATYFYLTRPQALAALARLEAAGEVERVGVAGLSAPHWLWPAAARPRSIRTQALVSPFDSLVFDRDRLAALFGTRYRIEVYTPAPRRQYGYYVYLFVCDEAVAARVDLKAARDAGVLWVQAAWLEDGQRADAVAPRLAEELRAMAGWLGLGEVAVRPVGTLAAALASAVSRP